MPRSSKSLAVVEEFDENDDFEGDDADSDEWHPDPDESKGKRGVKRKSTSTRTSASKKSKDESEDDEDQDEEEVSDQDEEYDNDDGMDDDDEMDTTRNTSRSKNSSQKKATTETDARNFPDRQGIFTLYAYKGDLKNGLRANSTICLWRRDGQSLLQKYTREKEGKAGAILFSSTMVYSCWEDRRKDEYLEVRVKCVSNQTKDATRDSRVELLDIDTIEQTCVDGKYHELELEPYVSFADRKKQEEQANGGAQVEAQGEEVSEGEE